jgi:hypothetical protein
MKMIIGVFESVNESISRRGCSHSTILIDKLPSDEDKVVFTKLLNDCYKYAVAIYNYDHPFPAEPLIMSLLLSQHKLIRQLKSMLRSKQDSQS